MRKTSRTLTNGQTWPCPAGVTDVALAMRCGGSGSNVVVYDSGVPVQPGSVYTATVGASGGGSTTFAGVTVQNAAGGTGTGGSLSVVWGVPSSNAVTQEFLADGTWVAPANYSGPVLVEGCGGGGGGGRASTNRGAGGGGGSLFQNRIVIVEAGVTYTATIGTGGGGGAGGTGTNGTAGNPTTLKQGATTVASLTPGNPGIGGAGNLSGGSDGIDNTFALGGAGRAGSNPAGTGGTNIYGTYSGGTNPVFNNSTGGAGGAGPYGNGANGNPPNYPTDANGASASANTGAGGAGGTSAGGLNGNGGAGGSGRMYLTYWPNANVAYQQFTSSGTWVCPADVKGPVMVCNSSQDTTGKMCCRWIDAVPGTAYSITTTSALGETWTTAGTITVVWFPG